MHIVLGPRGCLPLARRAIELAAGAEHTLRLRAESAHGYLTVMAGDSAGLGATAAAARAVHANPRPDARRPGVDVGAHQHPCPCRQVPGAVRCRRSMLPVGPRGGGAARGSRGAHHVAHRRGGGGGANRAAHRRARAERPGGRAHRVGPPRGDLQRRRPLLRAAPSGSPGGGRRLLPSTSRRSSTSVTKASPGSGCCICTGSGTSASADPRRRPRCT